MESISFDVFKQRQGEITLILLAGKTDRCLQRTMEFLSSICLTWEVAIVGREVAYQQDVYCKAIGERGHAFAGDPHYFVEALIVGSNTTNTSLLWDPTEYQCSYLDAPWIGDTAYIRLSNGCQRICGYCPYGYYFEGLCGKDRVLTRPVAEIEKEVVQWAMTGKRDFRFVADQTLLCSAKQNDYLDDVCRTIAWWQTGSRIAFTTTPFDVLNNRRLLAGFRQQVSLRIFLCFDTIVDPLLAHFNLPFNQSQLSEAINFLKSEKIDIYPHFIFINPFMNSASIFRTLDFIEEIIPKILQGADCYDSAGFIRSLFCSALRQDEVTPADPKLRLDIQTSVPDERTLGFVATMIHLFHSKTLSLRFVQAVRQHSDWPRRLAEASRSILTQGTEGILFDAQMVDLNASAIVASVEKSNSYNSG